MERGRDSKGRQFPAILSLPPCPKVLPFFLQTPKIQALKACGASRGIQSRVWEGGAPLLPPSLGFPPHPFSLLTPPPPWPVSPLLAPAFLPPGFLLHSCLLLPFFFAILPVSIALPPLPLLPSPTTLSTLFLLAPEPPTPPALQTEESKLSRIYLFRTRVIIFFPPVLRPKSWETLPVGPCNLLRGLPVLRPRADGGRKGRHAPFPFPTAVPPRLALPG